MSTAHSTPSGGWSVNARFAAAVLLTIARARQAPEEMLLRDRLKATLNLPDNVWSVFAETVRRERRRFERRSLKSLMGESPLRKAVAALKQMEPRTDGVFQAVTEWAAGTETGGAALCHACDNNVAAGFACGGCGKEWHGACAWLQLMDCNATSILSADDVFVANTRSQITCMMCRQLPGRRVARKDALLTRFSDWIERLEVCDAEAVVDACVRAGPSRRQLPGSDASVSAGSARWLAAAAAGILVEHIEGGDRAAELLLLHFPRLILRKGSRPEEQLTELLQLARGRVKNMFAAIPIGRDDSKGFIIPEYDRDITHVTMQPLHWWMTLFQKNGWNVESATHSFRGVKDSWTAAWPHGNAFFVVSRR